jgi:hypothetical protein
VSRADLEGCQVPPLGSRRGGFYDRPAYSSDTVHRVCSRAIILFLSTRRILAPVIRREPNAIGMIKRAAA